MDDDQFNPEEDERTITELQTNTTESQMEVNNNWANETNATELNIATERAESCIINNVNLQSAAGNTFSSSFSDLQPDAVFSDASDARSSTDSDSNDNGCRS